MVVPPKMAEIMGFQSEFYFVGFHFLLLFIIGPSMDENFQYFGRKYR